MLQQLMVSNRFVSLATDDPDNSDTDTDLTEPDTTDKPPDETSAASEDTLYYDANDDTPYFLAGTEPPQGAMGCGSTHQLPGHRWHYLPRSSNGCSLQLHERDRDPPWYG